MEILKERWRKLNNYDKDATAGGLWTSTTTYVVEVPTGKRWVVLGGVINRDANATAQCFLYDSSDNIIGVLASEGASTGLTTFPTSSYQIGTSWILDAGEYVKTTFGAAQGANAYHTFVVLEMDV